MCNAMTIVAGNLLMTIVMMTIDSVELLQLRRTLDDEEGNNSQAIVDLGQCVEDMSLSLIKANG